MSSRISSQTIKIPAGSDSVSGVLCRPEKGLGLVVFAHGSGSNRRSPRNRFIAQSLNRRGFASLIFDLLTPKEAKQDKLTHDLRFDFNFLAARLILTLEWLAQQPGLELLPVGILGSSTGAAVALIAASIRPNLVQAIVSRGGRPDLAGHALRKIQAPTLLIVGSKDRPVLEVNRQACETLQKDTELLEISGATHLFEEPGTLQKAAELAGDWFERYLQSPDHPHSQTYVDE